jgi:hypothetical protein
MPFLKEKLLQKRFGKDLQKPFCAGILRKWFLKKKPPCGGTDSKMSFQKHPFLKRKSCRDCSRGTSLIGEYHSDVIFGLTFLREEKEYEQGRADKFPLTRLFPTASIALHHGLITA